VSDDQNPGLDMNALLEQAQQMGEQLMAAQAEAASAVVEGQAGGGAVKIEVTGGGEYISVKIAKGAVNPDDVEMLEDLVLAALNDATRQIEEAAGSDGGLDLGGIDLGGLDLGGLLGGGDE
jgi:DNA-binding YbaB/EbfC family protein